MEDNVGGQIKDLDYLAPPVWNVASVASAADG